MSDLRWQKSSYSSGDPNQNCLEVARASSGRLHFRESDNPEVILTADPVRWAAFLRLVRQS